MGKRIWFDAIDSVGSFPDGRIKMDVVFEDGKGEEFVWTPRWNDIMSLYQEAERVEEINVQEGRWLDDLRDGKQFSDEVITEIAKILGDTRTGREISDFFSAAGFPDISHDGSTKWRFARRELRELNEDDYTQILQIIEKLADPKQYLSREDDHEIVMKRLNNALEFESLHVTEDGRIITSKQDGEV